MQRPGLRAAIATAATFAVLAQPAGAQSGNGLYEPFPQDVRPGGERFIERLPKAPNRVGSEVSREDLERGRFIAGGNDAHGVPGGAAGPASRRAGTETTGDSLRWPLQIAVLIALLAAAALVAAPKLGARRRRFAVGIAVGSAIVLGSFLAVSAGGEGTTAPDPPSGSGHLPADFIGIVEPEPFAGTGGERDRTTGRQRSAAIGIVRAPFDWADIETTPGRYDFARYDRYVADLATHGMRVLPILFDAPGFRTRRRGGPNGPYFPPTDLRDMGVFAGVVAARYGPGGSFWRRRPRLRPVPVAAWQVWNEPNLGFYWGRAPDPAEYTAMLAGARRSIRRVDPGAEVVSAGITEGRLGIPAPEFLEGMYRAGGKTAFDTLAIQAYARDAVALTGAVAAIRRQLDRHGDRRSIWLTEFGWATGGPLSDFTVTDAGQARLVGEAVSELAAERRSLGLRGLAYFRWRDVPPYAGGKDFFGLHTGLVRADGRAKPALAAFGRSARASGAPRP